MSCNCERYFLITGLACSLVECFDEDELATISADLVALGDMIVAMLARNSFCQKENTSLDKATGEDLCNCETKET